VSHVSHLDRNTVQLNLPPYYKTQLSELCPMCPTYIEVQLVLLDLPPYSYYKTQLSKLCPMCPTYIEIQFYLICLLTTKRN
jgi:hypothetical protein